MQSQDQDPLMQLAKQLNQLFHSEKKTNLAHKLIPILLLIEISVGTERKCKDAGINQLLYCFYCVTCAPERVLDFTFAVFCGRWKIMKLASQLPQAYSQLNIVLKDHCRLHHNSLTFNVIDNAMQSIHIALLLTLAIPVILPYVVMISMVVYFLW